MKRGEEEIESQERRCTRSSKASKISKDESDYECISRSIQVISDDDIGIEDAGNGDREIVANREDSNSNRVRVSIE